MAALFDLDAQRCEHDAAADAAFAVALDRARLVGGKDGLARLASYTRQIAAVEAQILAAHVTDDGKTVGAERLLNDGKTSKRAQAQKAKRAKAVRSNSKLADKLGNGEMSEEQVDVIADAAAKTDGAAAVDDDLINEVAAVPPEQGKSRADEFIANRATADGVQTEHNRQRALRNVSIYHDKRTGLHVLRLSGDRTSINQMKQQVDKNSDLLYKQDGSRDLPSSKHPRTRDHRNYDAAHQLICGTTTTTTSTDTETETAKATARPSTRPTIVVGLTIDKLIGESPGEIAVQNGLGLIPDSVLAEYAQHANIIAALFDRSGVPLWLGRTRRHASDGQFLALVLRDKGCTLCGAEPSRCQAHHLMPWNAPGKGQTNLDDLALLCGPCHTRLHEEQHTLYQDAKGTWRTRPATTNETPPPRPKTVKKRRRQTPPRE